MTFRNRRFWLLGTTVVLLSGPAFADLILPYTYASGTPIRAAEVNANFEALRVKVGTTNVLLGDGSNTAGLGVTKAVIAGGSQNSVTGTSGAVGGGELNIATIGSTVAGGYNNQITVGGNNFIGGGAGNRISSSYAVVGGGSNNNAQGQYATIGGGSGNSCGDSSVVAGGNGNSATGYIATIGGGQTNVASGQYATVPGGANNTAGGTSAFAAGNRAKANSQGCFVWGDSTAADITCNTNNRWVARSVGGVYFFTNTALTTGVSLSAGGGSWNAVSDRNQKQDFSNVNRQEMLEKVRRLPITTWRYKSEESGARHMGPMAQDFHAAFQLGDSDKTIATVDADGVMIAALQGLDLAVAERVAGLESKIATLTRENAELHRQAAASAARLDDIERRLDGKPRMITSSVLAGPIGVIALLLVGSVVGGVLYRRRSLLRARIT